MNGVTDFFILAFVAAIISVGFVVGLCVLFRREIIEEILAFREERRKEVCTPMSPSRSELVVAWKKYLEEENKSTLEWPFYKWVVETHFCSKVEGDMKKYGVGFWGELRNLIENK